jgi:error-prone DNA polymerase
MRQQPSSANGVLFVTLEDETGHVNVIVWPKLKQRHAAVWRHARLLVVHGVWQRDQVAGQVTHVVAAWAQDISDWLGTLPSPSRDFH